MDTSSTTEALKPVAFTFDDGSLRLMTSNLKEATRIESGLTSVLKVIATDFAKDQVVIESA